MHLEFDMTKLHFYHRSPISSTTDKCDKRFYRIKMSLSTIASSHQSTLPPHTNSTSSSAQHPVSLVNNPTTIYINGVFLPIAILLSTICNSLVSSVLSRPHMLVQPSFIILLATAITNTLTGLLPTPFYIHFYSFNHYKDYVPYSMCLLYFTFTDYLPSVMHTASVWLTVALALQRYFAVVCQSQVLLGVFVCCVKSVCAVWVVVCVVCYVDVFVVWKSRDVVVCSKLLKGLTNTKIIISIYRFICHI